MFLPEGVGPASGILQSIVRKVFADFDEWIIAIFDNFLILATDYTDAAAKLQKVLIRCRDNGLVLKRKKSWIGSTNVTFFGYEVGLALGVCPSPQMCTHYLKFYPLTSHLPQH
jgi:hypothetical protein